VFISAGSPPLRPLLGFRWGRNGIRLQREKRRLNTLTPPQEMALLHSPHEGVVISNQSLVLQNVRRDQSGIYTCVAHNIEGDGPSNPMTLNIRCTLMMMTSSRRSCVTLTSLDAPYCKPDQVQVFGVAREEMVRISCEVVSNPVGSTTFEWKFNASGEIVDMPHDRYAFIFPPASAMTFPTRPFIPFALSRAFNVSSSALQI